MPRIYRLSLSQSRTGFKSQDNKQASYYRKKQRISFIHDFLKSAASFKYTSFRNFYVNLIIFAGMVGMHQEAGEYRAKSPASCCSIFPGSDFLNSIPEKVSQSSSARYNSSCCSLQVIFSVQIQILFCRLLKAVLHHTFRQTNQRTLFPQSASCFK